MQGFTVFICLHVECLLYHGLITPTTLPEMNDWMAAVADRTTAVADRTTALTTRLDALEERIMSYQVMVTWI